MKTQMIIDVREGDEFNAEFIRGSINFPLSSLDKQIDSIKSKAHNKKVVIVCKTGNRAGLALKQIKDTWTEVDEDIDLEILSGGISAWKTAGKPTELKKKFHLPIMRQVQLIVGTTVLFFSSITIITGNTNYSIIPLLFGAGLGFAGLTGYCGMALALVKMPWNK